MLTKPQFQDAVRPGQAAASGPSGAGRILLNVFETFEDASIRYCVLHGYDQYPGRIKSDVDVVICADVAAGEVHALLDAHRERIGAEIVRRSGYFIILAGKDELGSACFLTLDLSVDCGLDSLPFRAGAELLASRRRYGEFWVPAVHLEFGCYVARTIAKGGLDELRARRLSHLYRQDPERCDEQIAHYWSGAHARIISEAARSSEWEAVRPKLDALAAELRRSAIRQRPRQFIAYTWRGILGRVQRVLRPQGLNVVLLGPDGAGKSSLIEGLGPALAGDAFARWTCWGFAPPLYRLIGRRPKSTGEPHGLPARSAATSILRAGYWLAYQIMSYARLRLALARSTLVLNDRHFVDILVDAKRYRYGGPEWLLRLIWRLSPKPDLVILLDAPTEVLQARKQEVPFEETARQRAAYLALMRTLDYGHVVDASQSRGNVVRAVSDIILRHLGERRAPGSLAR